MHNLTFSSYYCPLFWQTLDPWLSVIPPFCDSDSFRKGSSRHLCKQNTVPSRVLRMLCSEDTALNSRIVKLGRALYIILLVIYIYIRAGCCLCFFHHALHWACLLQYKTKKAVLKLGGNKDTAAGVGASVHWDVGEPVCGGQQHNTHRCCTTARPPAASSYLARCCCTGELDGHCCSSHEVQWYYMCFAAAAASASSASVVVVWCVCVFSH